jgi:hypothetical protein
LGNPRGRYDEHSSKSSLGCENKVYQTSRRKPNFRRLSPTGAINLGFTTEASFINLQKLWYLLALRSHCPHHRHLEWLELM